MNSQVFKSSNYLKVRRFFFSGRKNVQIFQSIKWPELTESEVLLACRNMLASVSLWKTGPRPLWKFHMEASVCSGLHWPTAGGGQDGKATTCLFSAEKRKVSFPLSQRAPEGDMNFLHQNVVPDEQGSPRIYLYLGGGFNQISLSTLAYATGRPDW